MRLKEFTEIDETPLTGTFPFKTSHFVKDISSRILRRNPEKYLARKFRELQAQWDKDFNPQKALNFLAQTTGLNARDVRAWLQHSNLMESDEV